jgi:hypothetical protein
MKIACSKSKIMAFLRQHPIWSKIVVENKILEQVNTFNYLRMSEFEISLKYPMLLTIFCLLTCAFICCWHWFNESGCMASSEMRWCSWMARKNFEKKSWLILK